MKWSTNSDTHWSVWKQWGLATNSAVFHWIPLVVCASILGIGWGLRKIQFTHTFSQYTCNAFWFLPLQYHRHRILSPSPHLAESSDRKWHVLVTTSLPYELLNPHSKNLQRTSQRIWTGEEANACDTHWRIPFLVNNSSANLSYPKERHILFIFTLGGRSHRQYYLPTAALTLWCFSGVLCLV